MKVSVICPTFRRPDFLQQAIDSFLSQDYENKEMIIVNDGGSEEQSVYIQTDPQIKYFWKQHTNQADTQNYGIEKATGDLICTLDDDDLLYDSTSLSVRVNKFIENPELEVIWTNGVDFRDNNINVVTKEHGITDGNEVWNRDEILINSMMFRKNIKDKIGGYYFDYELTSNEDWDFKIRSLTECIHKSFDINTVRHRVHGEMRSTLHRSTGELSENAAKMMDKLKLRYDK